MYRFKQIALLLAAAACFLASCGKQESASSAPDGPYQISATVGMIADIVSVVAGDNAEVSGIIGEGVDPHLYKPTSTDVKTMQSADVVFYNGLML
ncbi:MAG: zinc ABC transporter substrate-binding protein, partial [Verrucomicrobiales bacterium]|nr:zinc ABC transporter substrate-binding protein [Verrucomicrobiales bacterium]